MHAVYTWHMVLLNRARGQFEFLEGLDKYNPSETIARCDEGATDGRACINTQVETLYTTPIINSCMPTTEVSSSPTSQGSLTN